MANVEWTAVLPKQLNGVLDADRPGTLRGEQRDSRCLRLEHGMHVLQRIQLGGVELVHRCVLHNLRIEPLQLCLEFADLRSVLVQKFLLAICGSSAMLIKVFVDLGEVSDDLLILLDLVIGLDQLLFKFLDLVLLRLDALLESLLFLLSGLAQAFPLLFEVIKFTLLLEKLVLIRFRF